jgi:hypothetical protein
MRYDEKQKASDARQIRPRSTLLSGKERARCERMEYLATEQIEIWGDIRDLTRSPMEVLGMKRIADIRCEEFGKLLDDELKIEAQLD